jgi:hypothetical protein
MKALMILGAIVGFLIGTGFGLAASSPWPSALWRSCVAALIAAVLTRWWGRIWMKGLNESLHNRRRSPRLPSATETKSTAKL